MNSSPLHQRIVSELQALEQAHRIRILYACEAGSRAWGFPSPDSDYDVRFIYCHAPAWYLRLDEGRDTIGDFTPGTDRKRHLRVAV